MGKYNKKIYNLAKEGKFEEVDALIKERASSMKPVRPDRGQSYFFYDLHRLHRRIALYHLHVAASLGYKNGNVINSETILEAAVYTDDAQVRIGLIRVAHTKDKSLDIYALDNKAYELRKIIHKEKCSFDQAKEYYHQNKLNIKRSEIEEHDLSSEQTNIYLSLAANVLLFQGQQLVKDGIIPVEIYFDMLAHIADCEVSDIIPVFYAANRRVRDRVIDVASANVSHLPFFNSKSKIEKIKEEAEERYQRRVNI